MSPVQTLPEKPPRESPGGRILRITLFKAQLFLQTARRQSYSERLSPHFLELDYHCVTAPGNMTSSPRGFQSLTVAFESPRQLIGQSCYPSYHRGRQTLEHFLRRPI
jgi:hypothetical protein